MSISEKSLLKFELKEFYKLGWPIVMANLTHMLFGVIDTLMVGHLGTVELASAAFANNLFYLVTITGIGVANATGPLVARALGSGNRDMALLILKHSKVVAFATATILCGCLIFLGANLQWFNQTPAVSELAKGYLYVIAFTTWPSFYFQVYRQYCEATNDQKTPFYASIAALLINVVFNYLLIYGNLGFPKLGLVGAALATLIARIFLFAVLYFKVNLRAQLSKLSESFKWRRKIFGEILLLGLPSGFILLFEVGAFATSAIMAGWINETSLAAHQVVLSLGSMTFMVPLGISFAASIRVGMGYGQRDIQQVKRSIKAAFIFSVGFMSLTTVLFLIFHNQLGLPFSDDIEVLKIAASLFFIAGIFQLCDGIQVTSIGILRAFSDMNIPFGSPLLPIGYSPCRFLTGSHSKKSGV